MNHWLFLFGQWLKRDLVGRYRGTWLGLAWPVIQPLSQVAVFTLIFHEFMQFRWPGLVTPSQAESATIYALNVLAGLAVFNFYAEILSRSCSAVLSQPNLVTKVRFPLAILPIVCTASAMAHIAAGAAALVIAGLLLTGFGLPTLTTLLWLVAWVLPVLLYGIGAALLLGSLSVYVRDIQQVMPALISLLMFLTPIFYPLSAVPASLQGLFALNPIAWAAESLRAITLEHQNLELSTWGLHLLAGWLVLGLGLLVFRRLERGFSDVL